MVTIYGLEDASTGAAYIGCTAGKPGKRMREHRSLLKAGKHSSTKLQEAWNNHAGQFQMRVLETMPAEVSVIEKRERELSWMKHYRAQGLLLNENEVSFQPTPYAIARGRLATKARAGTFTQSPESNLKRRLAQLGRPKGHGTKIRATKQAKNLR